MMDKNARVVLKDVVYDYIKEQISEGEIMLGQLINEKEIAEALQISSTPVREAIKRLQVENVLTPIDGVGTLVNELSRDEIEDIYEIRRVLEIIALKTAIFRVVDDDVMRIKKPSTVFMRGCLSMKAIRKSKRSWQRWIRRSTISSSTTVQTAMCDPC